MPTPDGKGDRCPAKAAHLPSAIITRMNAVMQIVIVAPIVCCSRGVAHWSIPSPAHGGLLKSERVARMVVKAEWIIRSLQIPVRDQAVVIENGHVADNTADALLNAEAIDVSPRIVLPGFLNHTSNTPLLRGLVADLPRRAIGERELYSILVALGAPAMTSRNDAALEALVTFGLHEIEKGGATSLGEPRPWRHTQSSPSPARPSRPRQIDYR
jgi:hypothetical protein